MSGDYLYEKIYGAIAGEIESGQRPAGQRIGTEQELAQAYGVSRITSKRALDMLAQSGLAVRRRGLGTYVADVRTRRRDKKPPAPPAINTRRALPRLGLVMEDVGESYALSLYYALERQAADNGFQLVLALSYGSQQKEKAAIRQLLATDIQGIFVLPAHGQYYNTTLLRLVLDRFPLVLVDRPLGGIPAASVCSDNRAASRELTELLYTKGHHRIGYLTTDLGEAISLEERHAGYIQAIKAAGLAPLEPLVISHVERVAVGVPQSSHPDVAAIQQWLGANHPITALVTSESGVAEIARRAALQAGLRIPQDLAIATFDEKYNYFGEFTFTHIRQDEEGIARHSLQLMRAALDGQAAAPHCHLVAASLLEGATT